MFHNVGKKVVEVWRGKVTEQRRTVTQREPAGTQGRCREVSHTLLCNQNASKCCSAPCLFVLSLMQIVVVVVFAKQCLQAQICTSFVFLDVMSNGTLWCKTTCSGAALQVMQKPDSAFKLKGLYVIGQIHWVKKVSRISNLPVQSLLIWLTLRCWGNSSIPEGRFSKWF